MREWCGLEVAVGIETNRNSWEGQSSHGNSHVNSQFNIVANSHAPPLRAIRTQPCNPTSTAIRTPHGSRNLNVVVAIVRSPGCACRSSQARTALRVRSRPSPPPSLSVRVPVSGGGAGLRSPAPPRLAPPPPHSFPPRMAATPPPWRKPPPPWRQRRIMARMLVNISKVRS